MTRDDWQPDADVYSPDQSVRLCATRTGQLMVELQDLHLHSDESLAGQIRAAARVVLATLQAPRERGDAQRRAGERRYGDFP